MGKIIASVEPGSIAEQLDIRAGDQLVSMGGEKIIDWIDYQALSCTEQIEMVCLRDGEEYEYEFEKDEYEPIGLVFDSRMMRLVRNCVNHCLFCFVDQLPENVRPTMRVKDDDWRLSLMMGNYVTLTNVLDRELERIIRRKAAPLYISVHATEGELRSQLLGTPRGDRLLGQLDRLAGAGLTFHTQAVLCPGINDGAHLERTISDLYARMSYCLSLALVPVGLTGHRQGLCPLRPYTREEARGVIEIADRWRAKCMEKFGTRFVFPSDEFYQLAELDVPGDAEYEGYGQLDNGVGLIRALKTEYAEAYRELPAARRCFTAQGKRIALATGVSAAPVLRQILAEMPVSGITARVHAIKNHFFGETVTVAGLVTGGDLAEQMRESDAEVILIPCVMLRADEAIFLDDMTLDEVQQRLGKPVIPVGRRGDELLAELVRQGEEFPGAKGH